MLQTESDKIFDYLGLSKEDIIGQDLKVSELSKGDKFYISPNWYFNQSNDALLFTEGMFMQDLIIRNRVISWWQDVYEIIQISKKYQFVKVKNINKDVIFNIIDFRNRMVEDNTFNASTLGLIFI